MKIRNLVYWISSAVDDFPEATASPQLCDLPQVLYTKKRTVVQPEGNWRNDEKMMLRWIKKLNATILVK